MHTLYRILFSLLIFNHVFSCELPADLYPKIIIYALNGDIKFVSTLKQVSKKFYEIIDSPEGMKTIIAQCISPRYLCSIACARKIKTPGSKKYVAINEQLIAEENVDNYYTMLKNPYAHINCQVIRGRHITSKLYEVGNPWSRYSLKKRELWILTLLNNGANPHVALFSCDRTWTVFGELNAVSLYSSSIHCHKKQDCLNTLKIFLKHNNAQTADKKYIETKHLSINTALKQQPKKCSLDDRPFMTWCVDYLTLIAKYGFDIKTVQPHPLHYHLHNNPNPAPVLVQYLVQKQYCDPYEMVDLGDGSEPESPYMIVSQFSNESIKQELLTIFKTVKKQI